MEEDKTTSINTNSNPDDRRRRFILQVVQPGLAGLMDGTVLSLAPLVAATRATKDSRSTFLAWLATDVGARIGMAFSVALSDGTLISGLGES